MFNISNVQAANHIKALLKQIQEKYNIKVLYDDKRPDSDGKYNPETNKLTVCTHHLFETANYDILARLNRVCEWKRLFAVDVSAYHELKHCFDYRKRQDLSDIEKVYSFIDDNLKDYYEYNRRKPDNYYRFDLCEINAERFGIRFAHEIFESSFGKEIADQVALDYVNEQAATGIYFLPQKQFYKYEEIDGEFENRINSLDDHSYPRPDMEPCCAQILDRFKNVPNGLSQLKLITACVYKVRNYQRTDFVNEYGLDFWRYIASEYPDLVDLSAQNEINKVMSRPDVTNPIIDGFKGTQFQ